MFNDILIFIFEIPRLFSIGNTSTTARQGILSKKANFCFSEALCFTHSIAQLFPLHCFRCWSFFSTAKWKINVDFEWFNNINRIIGFAFVILNVQRSYLAFWQDKSLALQFDHLKWIFIRNSNGFMYTRLFMFKSLSWKGKTAIVVCFVVYFNDVFQLNVTTF